MKISPRCRRGVCLLLAAWAVGGVGGCQTTKLAKPTPVTTHPGVTTQGIQTLEGDLKSTLPELAKGHSDKVQLAWYGTSWLRQVDPAVKEFLTDMGVQHKRLAERLQTWAAAHQVDLKFRYGNDLTGKARLAMEKAQGDIVQKAGDVEFQRVVLVLMYSDYHWQRQLIGVVLPRVQDSELRGYLEESLRVHEAGFQRVGELLGHYQYQK